MSDPVEFPDLGKLPDLSGLGLLIPLPKFAKLTGITIAGWRARIRRGELKIVRSGRMILIPRSELEKLLVTAHYARAGEVKKLQTPFGRRPPVEPGPEEAA